METRRRVHDLIERGSGTAGRLIAAAILALITVNVMAVILETVDWIAADHAVTLHVIEVVSVSVFTAELLVRLWSCTADPRFAHPVLGRLRYLVQPLTIIDVVAIAPFFVPLVLPDLRFARAIRLLRLFRLLKFGRYSDTIRTLGRVAVGKREDLTVAAFAVTIVLVISSCLMYYVENEAQPAAFSSIPATMWWGIATLTTVGYGDIYPITPLGRFLGAFIALSGVGLVALPAGILAAGFTEEMQRRREEKAAAGATDGEPRRCPHCDGEL